MRKFRFALLVICRIATLTNLYSQVASKVAGKVVDRNGAAVVGASVSLREADVQIAPGERIRHRGQTEPEGPDRERGQCLAWD